MRHKVAEKKLNWTIDSAGTGGWHAGEAPDLRAQKTALERGIDISTLIARQFRVNDFDKFDLIFALDSTNFNDILKLARNDEDKQKVELLMNRVQPGMNAGVPDPWFDERLFVPVFEMIEKACDRIIKDHC